MTTAKIIAGKLHVTVKSKNIMFITDSFLFADLFQKSRIKKTAQQRSGQKKQFTVIIPPGVAACQN